MSEPQAYPDWRDPSWPWIAKLARAQHHIDTLADEIAEFQASAYKVSEERGANPDDIDLVLHLSAPIPEHFSTIVGDAIHNMRSSLDTLAFELARRHVDGKLSEKQERRTGFPIYLYKADSDEFFASRTVLYGPAQREALECVMPGHIWDSLPPEEALRIIGTRDDDVRTDRLWILNNLWNIDKHRHLHLMVWQPDLMYWATGQGEENSHNWRQAHPPYVDGSLIGTLVATGDTKPVPPKLIESTFELRLVEEGVEGEGVVDSLRGVLAHVTGVFSRSFMRHESMLEESGA